MHVRNAPTVYCTATNRCRLEYPSGPAEHLYYIELYWLALDISAKESWAWLTPLQLGQKIHPVIS